MITNYFLPTYLGGAEVAILNAALGLQEAGHVVRVLSITTRGPTQRNRVHEVQGIQVRELDLARRTRNRVLQTYDPAVAAIVRGEIEKFRPDVVHTHNLSGSSLAPIVTAGAMEVPVVATLHDLWLLCANNMLLRRDGSLCRPNEIPCRNCFREYDYWAPIPNRRRAFRYLTRNVRQFLSPSKRLIQLHIEGGYQPERFTLLRHGLKPLSRAPSGVPPAVSGLHRGGNTMAFVGAVVVSKGVGVILEALPALVERIPGFRLIVAGRGPDALERRLRAFGDNVTMLGHVPRSHIAEVYAGAGLTIMASTINENSPITVCESLIAGTPVLGARIGGIPELVVEQVTGYLYDPASPEELACTASQHFGRLAREKRDMRRACREYADKEFSVPRHVDKLTTVYRSVLAAPEAQSE